jgi:hypothetical protein
MTRAFKNIAAGCASAALLFGATAYSANAFYLGYGNGDATNEDFWAEQGVAPAPSHMAPHHVAAAHTIHRTAHYATKAPAEQKVAHHSAHKLGEKHS